MFCLIPSSDRQVGWQAEAGKSGQTGREAEDKKKQPRKASTRLKKGPNGARNGLEMDPQRALKASDTPTRPWTGPRGALRTPSDPSSGLIRPRPEPPGQPKRAPGGPGLGPRQPPEGPRWSPRGVLKVTRNKSGRKDENRAPA